MPPRHLGSRRVETATNHASNPNSSPLADFIPERQAGSYPETRVGSRASDFVAEYTWNSGRYVMRAVVLHEYGGPEKLKFEDRFPNRRLAEVRC